MPVLADSAQPTRRSVLSVARTTSATGDLQLPNHVCGTRYHSTYDCVKVVKDISVWVVRPRRLVTLALKRDA